MTHADAMAYAEREIDVVIVRYLGAMERKIRRDIDATGPEDDAALDRPGEPDGPWRRITVEEILMREAAALDAWRVATIAALDVQFQTLIADARADGHAANSGLSGEFAP